MQLVEHYKIIRRGAHINPGTIASPCGVSELLWMLDLSSLGVIFVPLLLFRMENSTEFVKFFLLLIQHCQV